MIKPIPYGKQEITSSDIDAVVQALKSDFLTQGPTIAMFESAFAKYVGAEYAVALSNGTAALHLAVMALGVQEGEYVVCTPITFAASSNCVRYCGGNVLFADIDPETYLLDPKAVEKVILENPDKKIVGVIPVDFAGRVASLEAFYQLAKKYQLWVLEDACHAPGGYFMDSSSTKQFAGNGVFADLTAFSFHPVKHIATGEGGMLTTNSEVLYHKLMKLRTHGITREVSEFTNSKNFANGCSDYSDYPLWYMEMNELGYNYRITDIQAALGLSQLSRATENLERRIEIAKTYTEAFANCKHILRSSGLVEGHAYHLYIIETEQRRALYDYLRSKNIFAQIHYVPTHLMPYYKNSGWKEGDFPHAEQYYTRCLSLPMYPSLTQEEQAYVIQTVIQFFHD